MLKILQKIKQATQLELETFINLFIYLLAGLAIGLMVANCVVKDTFCDGVPDYYLTDD